MTIDELLHNKTVEYIRLINDDYYPLDSPNHKYIEELLNEINELIKNRKLMIRGEKIEKLRHNIKDNKK